MNKRIICFMLSAILTMICTLTGCKSTQAKVNNYDSDIEEISISSQTIAKNSKYTLNWDENKKCILLEDVATGKIWSNIPYEYYSKGGSSVNVNSTINITVIDSESLQQTTLRGYTEAVQKGFVLSEKVENGIKITYCFNNYSISIPVTYTLREDSLQVTINEADIKENSKYLLLNVSLAPFLCSAQNTSGNSYLFIPSGSGALMYATENAEIERTFVGEVYGTDASRPIPENIADEQIIRLPVFGAKDGDNAILGILESGAESASIEAYSGNSRTGYSNIYPTFYVRGYDVYDKESYESLKEDLIRASETMAKQTVSVGYYPLSGEQADYNGMAKRYNKYLHDTDMLPESNTKASPYSLTMLGGVMTTSSMLGVPTKKLNTMTTFSECNEFIKELIELTGINPTVCLKGFGSSGIDIGKIAGNFKIPSQFGSEKDRKNLNNYFKDNNISQFTDFDLIRYKKSGSGYSYYSDCAKTAILKSSDSYEVTGPLRELNENTVYRLLGRDELLKAMTKLITVAEKKDITGLSFLTLGDMAYSDFSNETNFVKGNMEKDITDMIQNAKKAGQNVATGANAYAAAAAETIFDIPTDNGDYICFDAEIPFYQMVFSGERPMYSNAVNLSQNASQQIMKSAIGGTGVGFTVIGNYDVSYNETQIEKLYGAVYEDNKELIKNTLNEYSKFFDAVNGNKIEKYEIISKKLSKTVFENGVSLYANHTDEEIQSPVGNLKAYEYKWSK